MLPSPLGSFAGPLKKREGEEKASVSSDAVRVKLPRFPSSDSQLLFGFFFNCFSFHFSEVFEEETPY